MEKIPTAFSGGACPDRGQDRRCNHVRCRRGISCILFVCMESTCSVNPPLPAAEEKGRGAAPKRCKYGPRPLSLAAPVAVGQQVENIVGPL